jgi:transposase
VQALLGGCCLTTFPRGRPFTSRLKDGSPLESLRRWSTISERCYAWPPATRPTPTAAILDSRTLRSSPESGHRSGYDGAKRKRGSKVHAAVDTLGHLLALHITPANEQDRVQVEALAVAVQEATGESVEMAYVDQGYTGEQPAEKAEAHGIQLEVVKHSEAKKGFVLLPRRWVVERDFAWASRFRRLVKDY